jgi:hypothetical protein
LTWITLRGLKVASIDYHLLIEMRLLGPSLVKRPISVIPLAGLFLKNCRRLAG